MAASEEIVFSTGEKVTRGFLTTWHYLSYFLPVVLLIIGYFRPQLRLNVMNGLNNELALDLLWMVIAIAVWVIVDAFTVSNHRTTAHRLQENNLFSYVVAIAMVSLAAWMFGRGQLPWFVFLPALGAAFDAYITSNRAIENALGKPNIQIERQIG